MQWQDLAVCQNTGLDPKNKDNFFEAAPGSDEEAAALAMCAVCPVRYDCVSTGLNHGSRDENDILTPWGNGIWGELTERELRGYLNEDDRGRPLRKLNPKKILCPYCGRKDVVPLQTKRTKKELSCTYCGLTWWARIMMNVVLLNDEMDNDLSASGSDEDWDETAASTGSNGPSYY